MHLNLYLNYNLDKVTILDFGGGPGTHYELLKNTLSDFSMIDYHIVETRETVAAGKKLFKDCERISFHSEFPKDKFTICYCNSSLQYIDEWMNVVKKMTASNPEFLLIDDLPAGKVDDFITLQNYYECRIPHRFFNLNSAIRQIELCGYSLVYRERYFGEVLGSCSPWPMNNFDVNHRIDYSCSLLFRKNRKE